MRSLTLFIVFFIFVTNTFAQQEKPKGRFFGGIESNSCYYLDDSQLGNFDQDNPFRSNNYININYNYSKFSAGVQIESYEQNALLNFNPKFKGTNIGTFYLNYKTQKLDITIGHFYEQFGSGLTLRTWEDRQLGINNALRGIRVIYNPTDYLAIKTLYAKQRSGFDVSEGKIFGFDTELSISKIFKTEKIDLSIGYNFVDREEVINFLDPTFKPITAIHGVRFNVSKSAFYISGEYNFKQKDAIVQNRNISNDFVKSGNTTLVNFGYSKKNFGVDATLRRIENFSFLSERIPQAIDLVSTSLNFNDKILNFTPALTKQHHSNLANIYVYQAQNRVDFIDQEIMKAGETGGQVDFFYTFKKNSAIGGKYGTKIEFNFANWFNLPGSYSFFPANYKTEFLGRGTKYFSDYNLEIRKKLTKSFHSSLSYVNQNYNKKWLEGGELVKTNIVAAEGTYSLTNQQSFRLEAEHLWTKQDNKNWAATTAEYSFNKKWSFYATDLYNYGNKDPKKQVHFYNLGATYRNTATRVSLNYGRQRGGLVCVGGVCRFVPQSTGLSLSMNTSF